MPIESAVKRTFRIHIGDEAKFAGVPH